VVNNYQALLGCSKWAGFDLPPMSGVHTATNTGNKPINQCHGAGSPQMRKTPRNTPPFIHEILAGAALFQNLPIPKSFA
jgi:hypothetical protein